MIGVAVAPHLAQPTQVQQALDAIARNAGTLLLPGAATPIAGGGFAYGNPALRNYLDPAGTDILDSVTQVDQFVGLCLDSMGVLGAERLQDFVTGVGGTATAATYDPVTGIGTATRVDLSNQSFVRITGLTAAKSYRLTIANTGAVALNVRQLDYAGSTVTTVAAGTSGECVFTGNATCVITSAGGSCAFKLTSFKEIPGNHASQPTPASKPILRRGVVNRLPQSKAYATLPWNRIAATATNNAAVAADGTLTASTLIEYTATTTDHYVYNNSITHFAPVVTFAMEVKANGRNYIQLAGVDDSTVFRPIFNLTDGTTASSGGATTSSVSLGNGWWLLCWSKVVTNFTQVAIIVQNAAAYGSYTGDGVSGVLLGKSLLTSGAYTAQQIIDAGDIPVTTTAAASSARGNYWWQFDGSNDSFSTGITTGNEGWVCAGVTFGGAAANNETVFSSGAGSATQKGVWLLRNGSSTALRMGVGNGTALATAYVTSLPLLNVPRVVEGGWGASTVFAGVDGTINSTAKTGDVTAPGTALIGAFLGGILPLQGPMSAIVYCPVLPSAADRALIRRFVGMLNGQTL